MDGPLVTLCDLATVFRRPKVSLNQECTVFLDRAQLLAAY